MADEWANSIELGPRELKGGPRRVIINVAEVDVIIDGKPLEHVRAAAWTMPRGPTERTVVEITTDRVSPTNESPGEDWLADQTHPSAAEALELIRELRARLRVRDNLAMVKLSSAITPPTA